MTTEAQPTFPQPLDVFRELRRRNERRARAAARREELREQRLQIDRVVLAQRQRRWRQSG